MSASLRRVSVVGTGSFLPNDPVPNDRIDEVLGPLDDASPRVKKFVNKVGVRMLETGGIDSRHFAVDPETGRLTHSTASMAAEAGRRALESAGRNSSDVDLLLLSSPSHDQMTPPTSTSLQEQLGIESCAEMQIHSNCSGVGKCMQVAFDALRLGRYKRALVTYCQHSSVYLRGGFFNQPRMTKTQAALRYILADGAGAVLLEGSDAPDGEPTPHELIGTFVESVGGSRPPGMTAGAGVIDAMNGSGHYADLHEKGSHHLDQDFAAVNQDAGRILFEGVTRFTDLLGIEPASVDHIVVSIPTERLYEDNLQRFLDHFGPEVERIKFRARNTGYAGGASILLHFDEMVRSGELQSGQTAIVHSVESSKWMSAGFAVKW